MSLIFWAESCYPRVLPNRHSSGSQQLQTRGYICKKFIGFYTSLCCFCNPIFCKILCLVDLSLEKGAIRWSQRQGIQRCRVGRGSRPKSQGPRAEAPGMQQKKLEGNLKNSRSGLEKQKGLWSRKKERKGVLHLIIPVYLHRQPLYHNTFHSSALSTASNYIV